MSLLSVEEIERGLTGCGVPAAKARAEARRLAGLEPEVQLAGVAVTLRAKQDARDEKALVAETDKRMRAVGFVVVNYSQPRRTKQTPGIPDHEYFHPARGLFVKWEAKTPSGTQSPDQKEYQSWCDACGVPYLVGPPSVVEAWCASHGVTLPPP